MTRTVLRRLLAAAFTAAGAVVAVVTAVQALAEYGELMLGLDDTPKTNPALTFTTGQVEDVLAELEQQLRQII
jgi:hypothetical protein